MITTIILLIFSFFSTITISQNINIPDAKFNAYLVSETEIKTDGNSEIS